MTLDFSAECDAVVAAPGQFEGDAGDALDLAGGVDLGVEARFWPSEILDAARLAEIDAADQFADEHDVQARDQIALQAGGVGQGFEAIGGAQVGEHVHRLAQAQQAGFRAQVARGARPLRAADGAHQHRVAGDGPVADLVQQRRAVGVIAGAAIGASSTLRSGVRAAATRRTWAQTSGPMPSPGRRSRVDMGLLLDFAVGGDVERGHAAVAHAQLRPAGAPGGHVRAGAVEGQGGSSSTKCS
jgi:hypothetical protein